jgi:hypothetical protein
MAGGNLDRSGGGQPARLHLIEALQVVPDPNRDTLERLIAEVSAK